MGSKKAVKQAVMRALREMIRVNPDAAKAVAAIRRRGLPRREAQEELACALTGCLREVSRGMPDRWPAVLAALKQGRSAASLFPDERDAVLATMRTARIHHLPVIEDNDLKGIVSIGDLVKHRLDEKELEASVLLDISRMRA
jgi:hypothetical protein